MELGAEFLHGEAAEVKDIARDASLPVIDITGRRFRGNKNGLRSLDDFDERIERVMGRLSEERETDRSFTDALARMRALAREDRRLALRYVEGYHAADPSRISEQSLAGSGGDPGEMRIARLIDGYDSIVDRLAAFVRRQIRLRHVVSRIRWRAGEVIVESQSPAGRTRPAIAARAVIVTVPLGVLNAPPEAMGRIAFDPPIRSKDRAAQRLAMGGVLRITLRLDEPFWTSRRFAARHGDERFHAMSFVHTLSPVDFPTWWTPYPAEAPLIVGWCGGPAAWALSKKPREAIIDAATRSLARILGMSRRTIAGHVRAVFMHDWNSDPYTRGAYSYVTVGGSDAAAMLARPESRTVHFAGEHASSGRNGTVDGAIASGFRAAEQVLRDTRRHRSRR